MKLRLVLMCILLFLIPAYYKIQASSESNILVNILPENPSPNENTTINISSYANNLDSVLIQWSENGKKVLSGIGKKSLSINAPGEGQELVIIATIALPDGIVNKRIVIRPSSTVLIWQATDSHVPPFYKGKALPTAESEVRVVAIPEIKNSSKIGSKWIDPKNLTYSWQKDDSNDVTQSGYGKNYFTFINDYLENSNSISVTVSSVDQKYSVGDNIEISIYQPKIVFYKKDKERGTLWEQALNENFKITGPETIEAIPYFISPKELLNPNLIWNWYINDTNIAVPVWSPNLLPVQAGSGTSGTSTIKLEINNSDKIFETAKKELNVEF